MREISDSRILIDELAEGKESAWNEFLLRYGPLMQSACHRVGLDDEDTADVIQVTCIRVLHHVSSVREPAALGSWVQGIVVRLAYDVHRTRKRHRTGHARIEAELGTEQLPDDRPDKKLEQLGDVVLLLDAIAQLEDRCQGLIEALYLDPTQPHYKQVSEKLSIPIGSIGPTRARCLEKLEILLRRASKVSKRGCDSV